MSMESSAMTSSVKYAFPVGVIAAAYLIACSGGATTPSIDGSGSGTDSGASTVPVADAGMHAQMTPPALDSGGSPSTPTDAGAPACSPMDQSAFMPAAYVHAVKQAGKCTAAQLTAYVTACFSTTSTAATCTTFTGASANTACAACLAPPAAASTPGPIFLGSDGQPAGFNTPGCIELVDPMKGPACAPAYDAAGQCGASACSGCAVTDMASAQVANMCATAALKGTCSSFSTKADSACAADVADGGAASICQLNTDADIAAALALFCGM